MKMQRKKMVRIGIATLVSILSVDTFSADKVVVITLGSDEITSRAVFVTSGKWTSDELGGPFGADQKCQAEADAQDSRVKRKTFRAWLSHPITTSFESSVHAPDVFIRSKVPYKRVDGVQVASNFDDLLDGSLDEPIRISSTGSEVASFVYTGIHHDGSFAIGSCQNWTASGTSTAYEGLSTKSDHSWTSSIGAAVPTSCSFRNALYCFEQ
jgi:hypothetical protein